MVSTASLQASSTYSDKNAHAGIVSLLRSSCEESGAEYALFWSICNGRLCVAAAWAKCGGGRSFVADSCRVMLEPGEGAVGRVFDQQSQEFIEDVSCLSADMFRRLDIAKNCNIQSLVVVPWNAYGVLEFGAHGSWQVPPPFIQTLIGNTLPLDSFSRGTSNVVWEAVLWKRSRFLRSWRRRLMKLVDVGGGWHLSSWDVPNARITGVWELGKSMPYIAIAPKQGFSATMQLNDVMLATDSRIGEDAMEELATILNGSFMRRGYARSSNDISREVSLKRVQKDCPRRNSHSRSDALNSDKQSIEIKFECPRCENCGEEEAKGRLIVQPVNANEIGRWLCKGCFISAWLPTCEGEADGRLQGWPQWMSLTGSGALINSTPPRTQRYSRVR